MSTNWMVRIYAGDHHGVRVDNFSATHRVLLLLSHPEMGRPSTYDWKTFKKGDVRTFDVHPDRSSLASLTSLPRDWAERNGKKWKFKIVGFDTEEGTITVKRVK